MKIRVFGMDPNGTVVHGDAEILSGVNALEVVGAMMGHNPFAGTDEVEFMRKVLKRIEEPDALPEDPQEAAKVFLSVLQQRGLVEDADHPNEPLTTVTVRIKDGNALSILDQVSTKLKQAGYDQNFIDQFRKEATAGDYNNLLLTAMRYVNIE